MFGTLGIGLGLGSALGLWSGLRLVLVLLGTVSRYYCNHTEHYSILTVPYHRGHSSVT